MLKTVYLHLLNFLHVHELYYSILIFIISLKANKELRSIIKLRSKNIASLDSDPALAVLQDAVATIQHHDAITGTEKQVVANDYVRQLHKGILKSEESIGLIIG